MSTVLAARLETAAVDDDSVHGNREVDVVGLGLRRRLLAAGSLDHGRGSPGAREP